MGEFGPPGRKPFDAVPYTVKSSLGAYARLNLGVMPEFCASPNSVSLVPFADTPLTLVAEVP